MGLGDQGLRLQRKRLEDTSHFYFQVKKKGKVICCQVDGS